MQGEELVCQSCGLAYPVRDDIPVLLVDEARQPGLTCPDGRLLRRVPSRRRARPRRRSTHCCAPSPSPVRGYAARPARPPRPRPRRSRRSRDVRPRAVIAAGPDSRLLRAVLEPWCPVPFVAWPGPGAAGLGRQPRPGRVLAPERSDHAAASAVAEAVRRGCQVVVACPPDSMVADHAAGPLDHDPAGPLRRPAGHRRGDARLPAPGRPRPEHRPRGGGHARSTTWRSPARRTATSRSTRPRCWRSRWPTPNPLVWGGSVLAARAARRVAESIRRAAGRGAIAGDAEHLLPVIEATRQRDVFDDPFADDPPDRRPMLLVLDDGAEEPVVREQRGRLLGGGREPRRTRRDRRHRRGERGRALRLAHPDRPLRRGVPPGRTDRGVTR